jgi:hypothetical protein
MNQDGITHRLVARLLRRAQEVEYYLKSNLRVFSMTEVGYSLGMMLGPLLTGSLFEGVG